MRAKEIRELVKIVESSNVGELEITRWLWGRIRISKTSIGNAVASPSTYPAQPVAQVTVPAPASAAPAPVAAEAKSEAEPASNLVEVLAPMVGTFYRAPAPDAAPYVKEGDVVSKGKVLCIIEAMKLMNEIESEQSGKIVKVLVENAQPVEYNQPLFLIEP